MTTQTGESPLAGLRTVVTGASSGMGAAIAVACGEAGADVALVGRDAARLGAVAERVRATGNRGLELVGDLAEDGVPGGHRPDRVDQLGRFGVPGQEAGTDVDGTNSTLNVDASLQYTLTRHFKLTVEGINLTDEFQDQFNDSSDRVSFYHHTGREVLFGARYTY